MIIGVPKEIKPDENRVSITPAGVRSFMKKGHTVLIEKGAGQGSGFRDSDYEGEGARIIAGAGEVYLNAEMIIKVKEPLEPEVEMLREGQILYAFLHLAPDYKLTKGLMDRKAVAIAYETIEVNGRLALLEPMSEVAGKIAAIMGAYYSARPYGGAGFLPGGVAGVRSANFLILGGGTAGLNAAKIAAGLGARVIVMDIDLERMRYLEDVLPRNCEMVMSNEFNINNEITGADVIICAVLIPGGRTPKLITREMLAAMKPGSVIVDISVDQGGCAETSRPTTHSSPVYAVDNVIHYCVSNMPGAYPRTSTFALTNATLPFGLEIACKGWKKAALENKAIGFGINAAVGRITYKKIAEEHNFDYTPLEKLVK